LATSASVNYTINRDRMLALSLMMSGELASGETMSASQAADTNDLLNMMLKSMQKVGLKLWLRRKATVFLKKNTVSYSLNSTGAHAAYAYTRTTIKVNAVAAATTIDITSTSGMTAGDFIGFELNDGTSYWTTVATVVDPDTIIIPAPGLTSAADVGNYVYFFTTKIDRPLRVLQAVVRDSSDQDTTVDLISQQDYFDLSSKTTIGTVNQIHYDPQMNAGVLYVWPSPDDVTSTLELIVERPIEDMDSALNDFDVPQEWYEPILYGLAERAAIFFHVNEKIAIMLSKKADIYLKDAMDADVENTSLFLSPARRY
jgi:hypothetical protein